MNMKKIIASVAASALAVSALATSAFAAGKVTASIPFKDDGQGNWQLFLAGDKKAAEVGDIDITKVASMDITLSFDAKTEEDWAGGAVIAQSDALGWGTIGQWENATGNGKDFEGVVSGKPFTVKMTGSFAADDTFAAIVIQNYGIDMNIDAITLYDASGAKLLSLPGGEAPAATTAAASEPASTTAAAGTQAPAAEGNTAPSDKGNADTGVEGVAVVAALAVLAGGAVVVAKKRK